MAIPFFNALVAVTDLVVLGVCTLILFKCGARAHTIILILAILCIGAVAWFLGGPERSDRWGSLTAVATLLAVIVALLLDDIRTILHCPKIEVNVTKDLIEHAHDKYYIR